MAIGTLIKIEIAASVFNDQNAKRRGEGVLHDDKPEQCGAQLQDGEKEIEWGHQRHRRRNVPNNRPRSLCHAPRRAR